MAVRITTFLLVFLWITLSFPGLALSNDNGDFHPQSEFNRGNFLFEQQRYDEALITYRGIEEAGFESGPLFLNMAMSYVYIDSLGMAGYYFNKASRFRQTQSQAENGLQHVKAVWSQRHIIIPELSLFRFSRFMHITLGHFKPFLWGFVLLNFAVLFWASTWFLKKYILLFKSAGITFGILAAVSVGTGMYLYMHDGLYEYGIFIENGHSVYEAPDMDTEPVFTVYEGYTFLRNTEESPDGSGWSFVQMSNGIEGWVRNRGFRVY